MKGKKKYLILTIIFLFTLLVLPSTVFADETPGSNDSYEWMDNGTSISITNYIGTDTDITIPDELAGKPVTEIAGGAFSEKSVESVIIPDTVTSIGPGAFAGSTSLQSVTLPSLLSEIKGETFIGCSSLQSIDIPDSVTSIGFTAFRNCTSLSSVTLSDTLQTIGQNTFAGCTSLQNIELPAGLQGLVGETFTGCSALQSISFPASMTNVGNDSFKDCTSLTSVWVYSTDIILGEDGNNIFDSAPLTDGIYGFADSTADDYADIISVPFHALYTVSFDSKGGTAVDDIITATGSAITKPTDPTKTNYAFSGWYKDAGFASAWNFSTDTVTANTTLYAKWTINSYTVTFNSNGGSAVGSVTANYNTTITKPTDPTKTGYTFAGWYKNSALTTAWNFSTDKVTAATTLYAKWTINKYTLSVSSNNTSYGTVTGAGTYDYNTTATLKATPKAGCYFVSWSEGGSTVSTDITYTFTVTKTRSLTAVFAKLQTPVLTSVKSVGYNSIKLTWTAVEGATGYDIYRATSSKGTYTKIAGDNFTTYTNTGLTTGKTYYYKIVADCKAGESITYSLYSTVKSAKPIPSTPSTTVKSNSYTSIKVSWGKIDGASGYQVYRATSKTGTYSLIKTTTATSYTNSSLKTGKTYYYKVRAYRTVGSSKVYSSYSAYHSAKPVPSTPTETVSSASYNSIKVSWSKVSGATKYQVYRKTSSTGSYSLIKTTTSTSYTNTSLTTGKTYYYKVRAYHLEGSTKVYGSYSALKSVAPIPATPSPKAASTSYTSIKISWSAISGASGYEVYSVNTQTQNLTLLTTTSSLSYTNSSLTAGSSYSYKVRAYKTVSGTKVYSNYSTAVSAKPIPSTPTVKVTLVSYNSLNISWNTISGADTYEVYRATSSAGTYSKIATTTDTSYLDTGRTTGKAYYYKVRAYITAEPNIYSNYSAISSNKVVPLAPAATAASYSYSSIKISWGAIEGATGYKVYKATSSTGTYSLIATTSSTSYTNTSLTTGKTYYYKVKSYTTAGSTTTYSSYSAYTSAKPIPATPVATAERTLENNIEISWNKVSGATGYELYRATSSNGTYSKLKTTSATSYENKSLTENKTYYYKVRAYRTVNSTKIYGHYSAIVSATTKYMPKISSSNPNSTYYNISYISIYIENNGVLPITIYSDDAYLWDDESYDYDRDLVIVDNYLNECVSVTLYPGDSGTLSFKIIGEPTRYTPYSSILFDFTYDNVLYFADLSYSYGNWYEAYIEY